MGKQTTFTCPECNYSCVVSGEADRGRVSITDTYVCRDCKIADDISVGIMTEENEKKMKLKDEICCNECKGKNIEIWDKNCPKCDTPMKMTGERVVHWD